MLTKEEKESLQLAADLLREFCKHEQDLLVIASYVEILKKIDKVLERDNPSIKNIDDLIWLEDIR